MGYRRKPRGSIAIDFSQVVEAVKARTYELPDLTYGTKISNSRVKKWNSCKRAHHYAFNEKIEKKAAPAPLYKGKIIHECIEDMIYGRDWNQTLEKYIEEYNKMFEEEKEQYGDLPNDLRTILQGYEKHYKDDGLTYLELNGKKAEHDFAIEISREPCLHCDGKGYDDNTKEACQKCGGKGERPLFLVGKIDAVAQDKQGRVWLVEHKSFKNLPSEDFRWTNQQATLYTWVMPQIGFPKPAGVIWDYIRTKVPAKPELLKSGGLSKRKNIDTTRDVYLETIHEYGLDPNDYQEVLDHLEGSEDNFYRRIYLPTRENIIKPIVDDIINTAKEIYYLGETLKTRNLGRDCSFCAFKTICQTEIMGGDTEFVKRTEYRPSTYHVVAEEE